MNAEVIENIIIGVVAGIALGFIYRIYRLTIIQTDVQIEILRLLAKGLEFKVKESLASDLQKLQDQLRRSMGIKSDPMPENPEVGDVHENPNGDRYMFDGVNWVKMKKNNGS